MALLLLSALFLNLLLYGLASVSVELDLYHGPHSPSTTAAERQAAYLAKVRCVVLLNAGLMLLLWLRRYRVAAVVLGVAGGGVVTGWALWNP
jgi:hypothetical protein